MYIVVDGYNVLKKVSTDKDCSETQRTAFVNLCGRYAAKRGHKLTVIFDAGPCINPMHERQRGVAVIFSGTYRSADDLIIEFIGGHKGKEVVVVTSDREIKAVASQHRAQVVDPEFFYHKMQELVHPPLQDLQDHSGTIIKLSTESNPDLDALMKEASGMIKGAKDEDSRFELNRQRDSQAQKLSKKIKHTLKKIDKL